MTDFRPATVQAGAREDGTRSHRHDRGRSRRFRCAGALLNAISRAEAQRKSVQIIGVSPIIRALLLLIGISPRHFIKKAQ
jgi:hypothetical protein